MSRHQRLFVLCALLIRLGTSVAQDPAIDSLRDAMRTRVMSDSAYATASGKLAQYYWLNGEMDSVLTTAERGIGRLTRTNATSVGSQKQLVRLVKLKGMACFSMGQWPLAMEEFQRMQKEAGSIGDHREQGRALTYEGHTLREMGDNTNSAAKYREAFLELGNEEAGMDLGNALHGMGSTMTNMRQWDSAVYYFNEAIDLYQQIGDVPHAVGTRLNLAENYYAEGKHDLERAQVDSIAAHPELLNDPDMLMRFLAFRARTRMPLGKVDGYIPDLDSALRIAGMLEDTNSMATITLLRSLAHANTNDWPAAYRDLEEGKNNIWADMGIAKVRATEAARQEFEREKDMALADSELRKEQLRKWAAVAIGALALLLAIVWYRFYRAKSRSAEILLSKNEEIQRTQSQLIASEKAREAEQVRTRIARDIHDEIGASLTKIALLSGVATQKSQDPGELGKTFARISEHTKNVSRALSDVVWAVDPQRDTHQGMLDHVRDLSQRLLGDNGIRFELDLQADTPEGQVAPALKRDLHLVLNECFNNILKYAHAKQVKVKLYLRATAFELRVEDDGVGFEPALVPERGNGLKNMPARIAQHGGALMITSAPGKGVVLQGHGPLT